MLRTTVAITLMLVATATVAVAERPSGVLHAWRLDDSYSGPHREVFSSLRHRVPVLMHHTQLALAVRLGMDFADGWRHPLTVRFVDGAPYGFENALAFVAFMAFEDGTAEQILNINLAAYTAEGFDFEKVFAHELVHAMVNDVLGAEGAGVLPMWLHEGLAVYGADQGERMARAYVHQLAGFGEGQLLTGLDRERRSAYSYAEDYWAIKYVHVRHGQNALHNFVRDVLSRPHDIPGAIMYTCFESYEQFQKNVRAFALEEIRKHGPPAFGESQRPY